MTAGQPQPAFFPAEDYPELTAVRSSWREIRDEGRRLIPQMIWVEDERTAGRVWAFGPLLLEVGDRSSTRDRLSALMRRRATRTMTVLRQLPNLLGCGFSLLLAGGRIGEHVHSGPSVTAILGLTPAQSCWITVGTETRAIREGELTIFDYAQPHAVVNAGDVDRLALLILLPNKSVPGSA